jgi:GxxExxY protein
MRRPPLLLEELIYSIVGAFFEVYNTLGYGFLEHLYLKALERELLARGHKVAREVWVTVMYKGGELGKQRLDMIVDDCVVIEIKSTHEVPRHATRQLFNYLRATDLKVGLLLHFGSEPKFLRVSPPTSSLGSGSSGRHPERRGHFT